MLDKKGKIMSITLAAFLFIAPLIPEASPPFLSMGWAAETEAPPREKEGQKLEAGVLTATDEEAGDTEALEKEAEVEEEKRYEPDEKEMELLARAVYSEARGEPTEGQVAVAAVILNRLEDGQFPNTISGVIFQPRAFTAVADGQFWYTPNQKSFEAVEQALKGEDPSDGALYYYNPAKATSRWIFSRTVIKRIGRHLFAN